MSMLCVAARYISMHMGCATIYTAVYVVSLRAMPPLYSAIVPRRVATMYIAEPPSCCKLWHCRWRFLFHLAHCCRTWVTSLSTSSPATMWISQCTISPGSLSSLLLWPLTHIFNLAWWSHYCLIHCACSLVLKSIDRLSLPYLEPSLAKCEFGVFLTIMPLRFRWVEEFCKLESPSLVLDNWWNSKY